MQVQPYVIQVQDQLAAAAALGDERVRATATALAAAADPAVRLAVLTAVSAAADEITAALLDLPGAPAVAVRTDGQDLHIEVRTEAADLNPGGPVTAPGEDAEHSARISLRLPEALKTQIEQAARAESISVNTWFLRAAGRALSGPEAIARRVTGGRITGWING
ncbi:MAG TPA: hypothetical protein VGJ14_18985 [Sporichthyaceae bacterium]|jgi:hypothetical protein